MSKILLVAAAGAGYVLGSRAGRERYEQIRGLAGKTTSSAAVRKATSQVQSVVRERMPFGSPGTRVPAYSPETMPPETDLRPHHV